MKKKICKKQEITFHPMGILPDKKSVDDNEFSTPVLLFDICEANYCEIGYYDFKTKQWNHFGDSQCEFICWCYVPNQIPFVDMYKKIVAPKKPKTVTI